MTNKGTSIDEWGNTWRQKSLNDVLQHYKRDSKPCIQNSGYSSLTASIHQYVDDITAPSIDESYALLVHLLFNKSVKVKDLSKLQKEYVTKEEQLQKNLFEKIINAIITFFGYI
jgi:hypothetical protein